MDFEEQLEKAERLPTPSLVGSSIRSADDSAHNNYIHPEKSKGKKKEKPQGHSVLNQSIAASLDDLMREGALLGSEEDFEEVLDDSGNIKEDAKYAGEDDHAKAKSHLSTLVAKSDEADDSADDSLDEDENSAEPVDKKTEKDDKNESSKGDEIITSKETKQRKMEGSSDPEASYSKATPGLERKSAFYSQEDYSTPNLSEYQLDHQINDHKDLLTNIKSHDPHRLPSSQSDYAHEGDSYFKRPVSPSKRTPTSAVNRFNDDVTISAGATDGLHTPYFQRDSRSQSRSGISRQDRSRSRSAVAPHLARGDSYKNTNMKEPSAYELPPELAASEVESNDEGEDETQDRRSRQSKPTMGESIAAAEASKDLLNNSQSSTAAYTQRDTSLVTTGDYTNFDVDKPEPKVQDSSNLYSMRSASSTNYLRSISRSRSRQPDKDLRASNLYNEKNDADPEELVKGGALINEDPYSTIGGLDTMVEEVLHPSVDNSDPSKNKSNSEEKSVSKGTTDKNDSKRKPSNHYKESKPVSKLPDSIMKDNKSEDNKREDTNAKAVDSLSVVAQDKSKTEKKDEQTKDNDKAITNNVDDKAIEQIESSLDSKDLVLDKAQSLTSNDIHGDSSEANTKAADSIITEDREIKTDVKSDKNNLDKAAIDQIESSVGSKDDIIEKAESLTAEDIHAKNKAIETKKDVSVSDKNEIGETDSSGKTNNVNAQGIKNLDSNLDSKDTVLKTAETKDDVEPASTENKIPGQTSTMKDEGKKNIREKDQAESENSKDTRVETLISNRALSDPYKSDKSTDANLSLTDISEAADKEKLSDKVGEKEELSANSRESTKDKVTKKDLDDKAVEKIESSIDSSDAVVEKSKSLTADDIIADDINTDSNSETKPISDDTITEKKEIDKKDLNDKAAEQIESSIGSDDAVTEKAKSLTAEDIIVDSSDSKSATDAKATEREVSKKDVDNKAVEKMESSVDSNDAVTEKAKPLTADDIAVDSTSEVKPVASNTITENVKSAKAETSETDEKKEIELPDAKDTDVSKNLDSKEDPIRTNDTPSTAPIAIDDDLSDIDVSPEEIRKHLESQPVYIFTSLAGGMQIMTKTNRLTTILTANGIKFEYRDLGTDEEAKKIWRRQASGKTLPGVVRGDDYIGNWQEIDEANEEYRLREILYETL